MAIEYVCDACGKIMKDPHEAKMKEFYVGCCFDFGGSFPIDAVRKRKVHLCDDCFKGLNKLVDKVKGEK